MAVKELDVDALVGEDLAEVKKIIFARGWRYRVVREDGKDLVNAITGDSRLDRIKLTVSNNVVTDAVIG